jgi:hypothetical protein
LDILSLGSTCGQWLNANLLPMGLFTLYPVILSWLSIYVFFRELAARGFTCRDWRISWLLTCATWGAVLVAVVELASLGYLVTRPVLIAAWLIIGIIFSAVTVLSWRQRTHWPITELPVHLKLGFLRHIHFSAPSNLPLSQHLLIYSGAFVVLILLLIAFSSAPNNWDSLTYHLPRIMHWLQNGSVAHYPTAITRQISLNPWSEFAMMVLYALSDSDAYVAGVQWFSMLGSLIGASFLAAYLSEQQLAPMLAALLALSIPMGVMQTTSTQNDYVVAFWLVGLFCFGLLLLQEPTNKLYRLGTALTLGLAILTKGTAYLFALPFILLLLGFLLKRFSLRLVVIDY